MLDVYFAIPVLDENKYLFKTLDCIAEQKCDRNIYVYICINQPDSWWYNENSDICRRNQELLLTLQKGYRDLDIHIIDKTSKGKGWEEKKGGVGVARKAVIDSILERAEDTDVLISMDADTSFDSNFVATIVNTFQTYTKIEALNIPYYHNLTGIEEQDRAMLRYELYLRNYMYNMLRINSPYAFTAFGSAIACFIKSYKAVGGFDSQTAGEDFYFLQKIVKYGKLKLYTSTTVYPSARYSDRVTFGTGTAIADFQTSNFSRYPIFHYKLFDSIANTYQLIDTIFEKDVDSILISFLQKHYKEEDLWTKLRNNYKTPASFRKAFHHKIDGLRLFQFLRYMQAELNESDDVCIRELVNVFHPNMSIVDEDFSLATSPIAMINELRDSFVLVENSMRIEQDIQNLTEKK
ncbi:MAG TPA: hypothetical protein PLF32_07450 [Bacteroidales bacterium]|nr:hypothetical protein [Bacteroidales bacterium]HOF16467.1 hypothetical protein [Bacteroidales bacterium]HON20167.1 hypothetical protein [Bacteroidales bacterium]HOR82475.1 hypothetical protein [Bacteroidales bacterium]HPJ91697.1 hypothetical protein [Bacteroidales bacterium]